MISNDDIVYKGSKLLIRAWQRNLLDVRVVWLEKLPNTSPYKDKAIHLHVVYIYVLGHSSRYTGTEFEWVWEETVFRIKSEGQTESSIK